MARDLAGRVIAISGASSGIGAATALACAQAGMHVALFARREDKLRGVAERARSLGVRAHVVVGDAQSPDDNRRLLDEAQTELGGLHAVFANAGYGQEALTIDMPTEDVRRMFEVNFFGSLDLAREAIARFRAGGGGHALLCSSCLAKLGLPYYGCYSATKACQDHCARAMRLELAGTGVHVSSVHPVGTRTEFFETAHSLSEGGLKIMDRRQRLGMQPPERVARAVVSCLRRPRGEVWTSSPARFAFGATVMLPGLTDWALKRVMSKRRARAGL
ncbi:MAG: SDR family oxidoreductase [Planctomycetota bacterium]